ncbi:carbohydrate ABC transporter substrate-binding protein [uncultured Faecalicoccus sp.]|uniref:carbohydrate ABC transporter substrate-binding protein n=1 Tax=uncultured Faecalicoccus sp. TaxID=1971760 RepID=UPI00261ED968|nr:carbohydrate ABC transporter substrate-binding protein [uncultured Faecalicoccus sp.]
MKKLMRAGAVALAMATFVTGCSSGGSGDTAESEVPTNEDGQRILAFDAFVGGNGEEFLEEAAAKFEEANEDVDVQIRWSKDIDQEMQKDNASGKYADLVYYNLGQASNYTESMLNSGKVMDISDVMDEVADEIDTSITQPTAEYFGDGKSYLAPIMYTPAGLYYNKAELSEEELPTTWDEMFALGDKVHSEDANKYLFTYPIRGYFDNTVLGMLYQAGGEEYFQNALKYGEGTWDSDEGKLILETIAKLVGPEYLEKDTVANANVDGGFTVNQQSMIDGKALFMPNGSWIVGEMAETTPEGFSWGVMPLPAFEEGGERVVTTMTETVWIPAEAANADDAKEFIKFLYSEEAAEIFASHNIVSPRTGSADLLADEQLKGLFDVYNMDGVKAVSGTYAAYDATAVPDVDFKGTIYGPIEEIASGKEGVTVETWQESLTELWTTLRENPLSAE